MPWEPPDFFAQFETIFHVPAPKKRAKNPLLRNLITSKASEPTITHDPKSRGTNDGQKGLNFDRFSYTFFGIDACRFPFFVRHCMTTVKAQFIEFQKECN